MKADKGKRGVLSARMSELAPIIEAQISSGGSVRISPKGISMLPMLREGKDSVLLSPLPQKLKKYDIPLYRREDGSYILHRIVRAGETYDIAGDNQIDIELGVSREHMIAVVSGFSRGEKEVSMDGLLYKLYCRAICGLRPVRHLLRKVKIKLGAAGKDKK